jgi:hypothetical protein
MKKILTISFVILASFNFAKAAPPKAQQGPLTYGRIDASSALMAIEGDAASAIFEDMSQVTVQQFQRLQVKVGKSVTCFRGRTVAGWQTTCYVAFTDLRIGLIDSSKRMIKP